LQKELKVTSLGRNADSAGDGKLQHFGGPGYGRRTHEAIKWANRGRTDYGGHRKQLATIL